MKQCFKCRHTKPMGEFGSDRARFDGKNPKCKVCVNVDSANYRANNPDKRRATCATYREKNSEKCKQAYADWHAKDPARAAQVKREWVEKNKESSLATKAKWRAANRTKSSAIKASRSAASGDHTGTEVKALLVKQKHRCACCRASIKSGYHKDHIQSLKAGGANDISNIQLLCAPCNLSKGAKCPIEFMQRRGFLL